MQGVAYSAHRGGGGFIALTFGWSIFTAAGAAAMYFLGHTLQPAAKDVAAPAEGISEG